MTRLAFHNGNKCVTAENPEMFDWPIVTAEAEAAVLDVLRRRVMSGTDVTVQLEKDLAEYHGTEFALGYCNGTSAILGGMFGLGIGQGDEVICPSLTYWASAAPLLMLNAIPVFCDIDPDTLCLDPDDIQHRITPRTRAMIVVHLYGHPADMDRIQANADKHGLKILEDFSHAQGMLHKGHLAGTMSDVGCTSLMTGKSLACGEGGALITNDRSVYERAVAFGHYERMGSARYGQTSAGISDPELQKYAGVPMGGFKHRMHQMSAAMCRVQLRSYNSRITEIQESMNFFWDQLDGVPGLQPHRVDPRSDSTMGGWYSPVGIYRADELGGLPISRFIEAVKAEGAHCGAAPNFPLHTHPVFQEADVYHLGSPAVCSFAETDRRQGPGTLPVAESTPHRIYQIPWFKHMRPEIIKEHATAFRKVAENADQLKEKEHENVAQSCAL